LNRSIVKAQFNDIWKEEYKLSDIVRRDRGKITLLKNLGPFNRRIRSMMTTFPSSFNLHDYKVSLRMLNLFPRWETATVGVHQDFKCMVCRRVYRDLQEENEDYIVTKSKTHFVIWGAQHDKNLAKAMIEDTKRGYSCYRHATEMYGHNHYHAFPNDFVEFEYRQVSLMEAHTLNSFRNVIGVFHRGTGHLGRVFECPLPLEATYNSFTLEGQMEWIWFMLAVWGAGTPRSKSGPPSEKIIRIVEGWIVDEKVCVSNYALLVYKSFGIPIPGHVCVYDKEIQGYEVLEKMQNCKTHKSSFDWNLSV
jgi:hypothetical protein